MNSKMKNNELLAIPEVKAAIEAGTVVLIDKIKTQNPEYTNLYFMGQIEGIGGASAEVSEAASMLLGWNTTSVGRAIQNAKTEIADKFEVGHLFNDFALRCIDSDKPFYQGHTPRATANGEILYHNGKEVYRRFELVTKSELKSKSHSTLSVSTEKEVPAGVNADALLERAQA